MLVKVNHQSGCCISLGSNCYNKVEQRHQLTKVDGSIRKVKRKERVMHRKIQRWQVFAYISTFVSFCPYIGLYII